MPHQLNKQIGGFLIRKKAKSVSEIALFGKNNEFSLHLPNLHIRVFRPQPNRLLGFYQKGTTKSSFFLLSAERIV